MKGARASRARLGSMGLVLGGDGRRAPDVGKFNLDSKTTSMVVVNNSIGAEWWPELGKDRSRGKLGW